MEIFNENQHVYETRKLKVELAKKKHKVLGITKQTSCICYNWLIEGSAQKIGTGILLMVFRCQSFLPTLLLNQILLPSLPGTPFEKYYPNNPLESVAQAAPLYIPNPYAIDDICLCIHY